MKKRSLLLALSLSFTLAACAPQAPESSDAAQTTDPHQTADSPAVYTVNYPLYYFASRLADGAATITFPAPETADPAYWRPSEEIIAQYQNADLILLNGADFAKWVERTSLPESKVVNTSKAAEASYIEIEEATVHSHGPEGQHAHVGYDFNTYLDTDIAKRQAESVAAALAQKLPQEKDAILARVQEINKDLDKIDEAMKAVSVAHPDTPLIASHPVYNYLARRYQWNLKNLHWEPNEMPEDEEWPSLQELLKTHPAKFILWEGDPDPAIVERLKTIGLESVVFYPLGNRPAEGDYVSAMLANIERLEAALNVQ